MPMSDEVDYCRPQGVASARDLTAAPLFIAEAPRVGSDGFGDEDVF